MLDQLVDWARRHGEPADSKARALIGELTAICRPDGSWNDERVIVFTEYVDHPGLAGRAADRPRPGR